VSQRAIETALRRVWLAASERQHSMYVLSLGTLGKLEHRVAASSANVMRRILWYKLLADLR